MTKYLIICIVSISVLILGFSVFSSPAKSQTTHLVISEIMLSGGTGLSEYEFIELYNPTSSDVSLSGWRLVKKTAAVDAAELDLIGDFGSKIIPSHGFYLIANQVYNGTPPADSTYTGVSISSNNTIILYNQAEEQVDKIGMGSVADFEGTAAASSPANSKSIERKAFQISTQESMLADDSLNGNSEDTDNNTADFLIRAIPEPQNSTSAKEDIGGVLTGTTTPTPTESVTLTPTATLTPTVTPTQTFTVTPTQILTLTPTSTLTPTTTLTPTPKATVTSVPKPTPTSIKTYPFPKFHIVCKVIYREFRMFHFRFYMPIVVCR